MYKIYTAPRMHYVQGNFDACLISYVSLYQPRGLETFEPAHPIDNKSFQSNFVNAEFLIELGFELETFEWQARTARKFQGLRHVWSIFSFCCIINQARIYYFSFFWGQRVCKTVKRFFLVEHESSTSSVETVSRSLSEFRVFSSDVSRKSQLI